MNRENLKKLADYLLSGNLKAEFDMALFSDDDHVTETDCGSVGCAVGHGPYAGIEKWKKETWTDYCNRAFGSDILLWAWCFNAHWDRVDNTPEGAAKRILYMLEKGIPKNWGKQWSGLHPLCY